MPHLHSDWENHVGAKCTRTTCTRLCTRLAQAAAQPMQLVDAAANPCNALIWSHHWWALPVAKLSPYIEPGTEAREQAESACPVVGASRQRTGVELISKNAAHGRCITIELLLLLSL